MVEFHADGDAGVFEDPDTGPHLAGVVGVVEDFDAGGGEGVVFDGFAGGGFAVEDFFEKDLEEGFLRHAFDDVGGDEADL